MNFESILNTVKAKKIYVIVGAAAIALAIFLVILFAAILPNGAYNNAVELMNEGKYEEAIVAFAKLDGRKDSQKNIEFCQNSLDYASAEALMDAKSYSEAMEAFKALGSFNDSAEKVKQCQIEISFNEAVALKNSGKNKEAYELLVNLKHKDANSVIAEIQENAKNEIDTYLKDYDCLGAYNMLVEVGHTSKSVPLLEAYKAMGEGDYKKAVKLGAKNIIVQKGTKKIESSKFYDIDGMESVDLPSSVKKIDSYAFSGCGNLIDVKLPSGLEEIGYESFSYCSNLENLYLPESLVSIGDRAFAYCSELTSIKIPSKVKQIGEGTFYECSSLKSINIPSNIISIGASAFSDCYKLESVTVKEGVTSIGDKAFYDCTSLKTLSLPSTLTHVGDSVFAYTQLVEIDFGGKSQQWKVLYNKLTGTKMAIHCENGTIYTYR